MRDLALLPKADLHCHLEGCARPETVRELAAKYGIEIGRLDNFHDLPSFLANYKQTIKPVVRSIADLRRIAAELIEDRVRDGAVYCEVMWTPHIFTELEGLASEGREERIEEVFEAVNGAMQSTAVAHGAHAGHLIGVSKSHPEDAVEIAEFAVRHKDETAVSFGMYGNELLDHAPFRPAAEIAQAGGVLFVPHAGEVRGAESVAEVISFGAKRISHGVRTVEDPGCLELLKTQAIACDVGLSSNVQLGVVSSLGQHPILQMVRSGVPVTLGTDDSLFFGASLLDEYKLARSIGLTDEELAAIARNSIIFSGLEGEWRESALRGIEEWLASKV